MKHSYLSLLKKRGFVFFLITQFLGAMNDNIYRLVVSLILVGKSLEGEGVSLTAIVFLIPAVLFSGYAGYFADKYSKRWVLIVTKSFEVLSMLLAAFALGTEHTGIMLAVLFTMATQSAFFSPAKYGIVPEIVKRKQLSRANALLEMSTYIAIIIGSALAGILMQLFRENMGIISGILIFIAALGVACSFGIPRVKAQENQRPLYLNPATEIIEGLKQLKGHRFLTFVVIGICFFWAIAISFQLNLLVLASNTLNLDFFAVALMQTVLGLGIGAGALLAGKLSGDRIEYGLIPLGLLGMSLGTLSLYWGGASIGMTYFLLVFTSISTGLFIVPLKALQQDLPARNVRGRLIATTNVFSNLAMMLASVLIWWMQASLNFSPALIFLILGLVSFLVTAAAMALLPAFFIRLALWVVMHTIYRVRVFNEMNVPRTGPALLVCNHVSYIDALILSAVIPRFIRYLIHQHYYDIKMLTWVIRLAHAIPIDTSDETKINEALDRARKALKQGHMVCVFAEGRITRTGNLLPFRHGFEKITRGLDVPIIPVHLDKLWHSIFSFKGGKFFWKLPGKIPVDISVSFGEPMSASSNAWQVRQAVQELGSEAQINSHSRHDILGLRLLQASRFRFWQSCVADNHDEKECYLNFMAKALLMSSQIKTRYADQTRVGILLPPSVQAALVNVACVLAGKVVVNLPYHDKATKLAAMIEATELKRVITTDTFLDGLGVGESSSFDKLSIWYQTPKKLDLFIASLATFLFPAKLTLRLYGEANQDPNQPVYLLGSMEEDRLNKTLLLSHRSILFPVASFRQVFTHLNRKDCVAGVLPFYAPLGLLGTLWLPLLDGMSTIYHTRAKHDPKGVGKLIRHYHATILFDVMSGYQLYYKNIKPEDFSYIDYAIVGRAPMSEEVSSEFLQEFNSRFDIELLEGYGNAETGPVSMNIPNLRLPGQLQMGFKRGSAGMPLPYVSLKIVDPVSLKELAQGQIGLLLVKTPFRMLGYLNDDLTTEQLFLNGWYNTGDQAFIDEDGFLFFPHSTP